MSKNASVIMGKFMQGIIIALVMYCRINIIIDDAFAKFVVGDVFVQ